MQWKSYLYSANITLFCPEPNFSWSKRKRWLISVDIISILMETMMLCVYESTTAVWAGSDGGERLSVIQQGMLQVRLCVRVWLCRAVVLPALSLPAEQKSEHPSRNDDGSNFISNLNHERKLNYRRLFTDWNSLQEKRPFAIVEMFCFALGFFFFLVEMQFQGVRKSSVWFCVGPTLIFILLSCCSESREV